ncbi:Protein asteroid1 [Manis javanica]|nr:Protein asteroid1 [Manis javanica]
MLGDAAFAASGGSLGDPTGDLVPLVRSIYHRRSPSPLASLSRLPRDALRGTSGPPSAPSFRFCPLFRAPVEGCRLEVGVRISSSLHPYPKIRLHETRAVLQIVIMGIRGLMSFVEDHSNEFFTDLKLQDTKIIIDGYALFHCLCFNSNLELQYGGDYDSFADVVQKFFESLFACNICPYVVLDGGCDISDKKLTTLKDRAREKIQMAHSLSVGGGGYVCPLLIREVFIQVLIKLQVCFVQCFSEADRDIMTLANYWNCPVLSSDSDFCIFDLKIGFCPLNSFQWRNMNTIKGTQDYYIPAKCFSLDALCRHFSNMNKALLPLFAVLCGNDHVNLPVVETFLSKVRLPLGGTSSKRRRHHRILGLLNWLSHFADPTEALDNVLKYLPKKDQENVKELLCCSMEEYQQSQVENMQRPNAHRISLPIRQIIYGLLLNASPHLENISWNASPPQPLAFSEVERINKNIKTSIVDAVELPKDHSDLNQLTELSLARRQILLLETLKVKQHLLDPVPDTLKLPIAISCYWLQHMEARAKLHHVQALLLGMLTGPLHAMIYSSGIVDSATLAGSVPCCSLIGKREGSSAGEQRR